VPEVEVENICPCDCNKDIVQYTSRQRFLHKNAGRGLPAGYESRDAM
jgi:hypothetical protein